MKRDDLRKFFEPKSIAIIGASIDEKKVGGILLRKAMTSSTEIFPINLNYDKLLGLKCYSSVLNIPKKIDLAVIAIPSAFVPGVFEECGKKGIRNIILISSGFSEVGNAILEKEILNIAKKYDIRFIGSNCFGVANPSRCLDLTFSSTSAKNGDIAFISQSGALWSYVSDLNLNFGFSKFVSLGNMENMNFNDFIEYFSLDKKTKKIVLYIERIKDGKKFIDVCKKAKKRGKKIYAIKGGNSDIGSKAAISHTASLASDYAIYSGALKQAEVSICENFLDLFGKLNINKKNIKLGKKSFILTNAGGAGVLLSDYLHKKEISVIEKPLDILGTASSEDYRINFNKIKNKKFDNLFVVSTAQSMANIKSIAHEIVSMNNILKKMNKKIIAVFLGGKSMSEASKIFEKNRVEYVNHIEEI